MQQLLERLNGIGFERTRRAVAALVMSLFVSLYLALAFLLFVNGQEMWVPAFIGLAVCYGVAFMGVAAEWFWGRWFAAGLGWSGFGIAVASMVMSGQWNPVLAVFGGMHGLVVLALAGQKMVARYDDQPTWRERYGMDEFGVARLRKTVTRTSASLPSVILWALGPKDPGQGMLALGLALAAGFLAIGGLRGITRLRTWGVLSLAGAAALFAAAGPHSFPHHVIAAPIRPELALALLAAAVLPFAGPLVHHLRGRR
ncbi:MAG TPA: hypothetical protein VHJ20_20380 [Polyangia bacterium]|nr:hypothetical protein [Polyangia bacterium]